MNKIRPPFKGKSFEIKLDHNPYHIRFYNSENNLKSVIVFPIFHFEEERQYYDLLRPIIERGDEIITINLLTKNDHVLHLNYYFEILERIIESLFSLKIIKKNKRLILMGFGVGAYLVSKLHNNLDLNIDRMILISPLNSYKDEYELEDEIGKFNIPTYIHFGQFDDVVSLDTRYKIFEKGHSNPFVQFYCYPVCGHYLFYKDRLSLKLDLYYKNNKYNPYIGKKSKYQASALPEKSVINENFYTHLFNEIDDIPNKKKIVLLTDVCPLFVNGVAIVMELLQKELQNLGYEVYIAALWNEDTPFKELPNETYIPILATYASFLKGYKELQMLKTLKFQKYAKMLAIFDFDYIHLHTEYSIGVIATKLAKITGVKILYSYHTLWNSYYQNKFGRQIGNLTYTVAKDFVFNKIYADCQIITVPTQKSYEILKKELADKDIRILPSPIDSSRFILSKVDYEIVDNLRKSLNLKEKKVIGYVGRVSLEKNITEILEYVAKIKIEIPNLVFVIVGNGDAVLSLKKAAKRLKIEENVIFVGEIENSKLKYYYSLFDVFSTASTFETQGLTYFEAATCGTPILAKMDKVLDDIFIDGVNAFIYQNYEEWAVRLEKILFGNIRSIINNAKKTMIQYSSSIWAKKIESYYKELNQKK